MSSESRETRLIINKVVTDFEERWSLDQDVEIQSWLERIPAPQQADLLRELVRVDLELRSRNEVSIDPKGYQNWGVGAVEIAEHLVKQDSFFEAASVVYDAPELDRGHNQDVTPSRIDNYELVQKLGGGGMGDVYLARHHKFKKRFYAIKLLKTGSISAQATARFEHEIDVAGQLKHPNIVFAIDAGRFENSPYLVMEYVQGVDLQDLVNEQGPISIANSCEMIRQAAEGLEYAYQEAGITHRDVKPANLMLGADHRIRVMDLGLARLREQSLTQGLTVEGQVLGTPNYIAPEQWRESSKVDTTADIYSLACSLYTLLVGKPPFYGKQTLPRIMSAHLLDPAPDPRESREDIDDRLAEIISRCLAKDPEIRLQTPKELAEALKPFCEDANLKELKVAQNSVGAASFIQTNPALEDTTFRYDVTEDLPATESYQKLSRPRFQVNLTRGTIGIILVFFILVIALIPTVYITWASVPVGGDNENGKDVAAEPDFRLIGEVRVNRISQSSDGTEVNKGSLGEDTWNVYSDEAILFDFSLREDVKLEQCRVVVVQPDSTFESYTNEEISETSENRFQFPKQGDDWGFTEGAGPRAFLLFAPLDDSKANQEPNLKIESGSWAGEFFEKKIVELHSWPGMPKTKSPVSRRIQFRITSRAIQRTGLRSLAENLQAQNPDYEIRGLLFNVENLETFDLN